MTDTTEAAARASAIRYALDCIDTEVKLASSLETIQDVTMNTSFIRHDLAALDAARIAAEQRAERWKRYFRAERTATGDHFSYTTAELAEMEDAWRDLVEHGDLDAEPAPARAEGGA